MLSFFFFFLKDALSLLDTLLKLVRVLPCVLCERAWAFRKPSAKPVLKASWCASGMLLLFRRLSKVSGTWPLSRISKPCRDKTRVNCRPAPSRFTTFSRLHVDQTFIKDGVNESVSGGCSKPPWRRLVLDFRVLKPRLWINTERDRERASLWRRRNKPWWETQWRGFYCKCWRESKIPGQTFRSAHAVWRGEELGLQNTGDAAPILATEKPGQEEKPSMFSPRRLQKPPEFGNVYVTFALACEIYICCKPTQSVSNDSRLTFLQYLPAVRSRSLSGRKTHNRGDRRVIYDLMLNV